MYERLYPAGGPVGAAQALADAPPGPVYVSMISTLDGRIALDGRSSALGGPGDLEMLLELRTAADGVLIGAATVCAEGYGRLVRSEERRARRRAAGLTEDPVAVVLSRRFDVPWEAGLFAAPEQPVLVYTAAGAGDPPPTAAPVEVVRLADPTPALVLADLRARGTRRVLCEGGPTLVRALTEAGLVDELFLTLTPLVTADTEQPGILTGPRLPAPRGLALRWVLRVEDELYLRYSFAD